MMTTDRKYRWVGIVLLWTVAIVVSALLLDRAAANWSHEIGADAYLKNHKPLRETLKAPGYFPFTVLLAGIVAMVHRWRVWASAFLLSSTATAALNQVIKWMTGRARPFRTLSGDSAVLTPFEFHPFPSLDAKNLCFPSGHAALAFATAACLSILWPKWKWVFYPLALLVAAERVMENAHWLSDTVAAAALGIGGVYIMRRVWWDKYLRRNESNGRSTLPLAGHPGL